MDLRDTPEEAEFRSRLRTWLDANLPEDKKGSRGGRAGSDGDEAAAARPQGRPASGRPGRFDDPFMREWSRKLYEAGYAGLTWPKEYGGAGAPYSFQAIFYEEMAA
ncbi:MAG TPA: acyl-CoA dehydrogenase family protein, partial [Gaiellaceae bacterium]